MITQMYFQGGPGFMSIIYLMWIVVIGLMVRFVVLYLQKKSPQKVIRANNGILFTGSIALLIGITGQMVGLTAAFDAIQRLGTESINPQMLAGGLKVTFIAPLCGMMLLILSAIFWFVSRNLKGYPSMN